MLKKILIGVAALIVVLVVVVAMQPADFKVSRTVAMAAAPAAPFAEVNDFHRWQAWSPWAKLDPKMKVGFEGPPSGTGAINTWAGNSDVGKGRATIIESRAGELVRMKLEFFEPFAATSTAQFAFKPEGAGTAVTWTMEGKNNFIGKAIGLFMDCDKMVGGQFEKGLAAIKAIVEKRA